MQPLAIVVVMGLLGMLSIVGALMMVMGSRRLFVLAEKPSLLMVRMVLPTNAFLFTLGLLVMALGLRGIYRLIWVV